MYENEEKVWVSFKNYHDHVPVSVIKNVRELSKEQVSKSIRDRKQFIKSLLHKEQLLAGDWDSALILEFFRFINLYRAVRHFSLGG